jgi:uncharacterized protein (UPF0548 family)
MFFLSRPTAQRIDRFRQMAKQDSFSYPEVGATLEGLFPDDYNLDHNRIRLGEGLGIFERAFAALCDWKMFDIEWVELLHPLGHIAPGQTVLVLARTFGLYSLSASRVIGMMDDDSGSMRRRGFSYGTLQHHVERGEERFSISITRRMTRCGTTSWHFPSRSTRGHVSATPSPALPSGVSLATQSRQCCAQSPDTHEANALFATLEV